MANIEETIFSTIGDLLVEINDEYADLTAINLNEKEEELLLLEVKVRYLSAHLEVLQKLRGRTKNTVEPTKKDSVEEKPTQEENAFTPPVVLEKESDEQPTEEEIESDSVPSEDVNQGQIQDQLEEAVEQEENVPEVAKSPDEAIEREEIEQEEAEKQKEEETEEQPQEKIQIETETTDDQKEIKTTQEDDVDQRNDPVVLQVVEEPKEIVVKEAEQIEEEKPNRPLTLNEILMQQKKGSIGGQQPLPSAESSHERIGDLKTAINLNDKLLFIKDLFNGYSLAYSEAIELLNRYHTFGEADAFLQTNYALKNNWAAKPQTVEKLYAILRKRYI